MNCDRCEEEIGRIRTTVLEQFDGNKVVLIHLCQKCGILWNVMRQHVKDLTLKKVWDKGG